jgi:flagellin-specific chaperone FliS
MESSILSAPAVTLVQMIYDVAINSLEAAMDKLASSDAMSRARLVSRAQAAIAELIVSLDHSAEAPLSSQLERLYDYALSEIAKGHAQRSGEAFRNAHSVLIILSEGWAGVCRETVAGQDQMPETLTELEGAKASAGQTNQLAEYQAAVGSESRCWSC